MAAFHGIERLLCYLITVNAAKMLLLLVTFITGVRMLTPAQMLISGQIFDLASIMIIAFERPDRDILRRRPTKRWIDMPIKSNVISLVTGVILAFLEVTLAFVLILTGLIDKTQAVTPIFISTLLAAPIILLESSRSSRISEGNVSVSNMFITAVIAIILTIASGLIFPAFGRIIGIYRIHFAAIFSALLPSGIMLIISELIKKKKKPQNKSDNNQEDNRNV